MESLAGTEVVYPAQVVLVASLKKIERIAKAGVQAWVEGPDGAYSGLTLADNGISPDEHVIAL